MSKCVVCQRPTGDGAALDARCEASLTIALGEVTALTDELEVTISRQTASGPQEGGRSAEKPLPVNMNAVEIAQELRETLMGWVLDFKPALIIAPPNATTQQITVKASRFLMRYMPEIRVHKDASMIHEEISYIIREAWRKVDRPQNRSRVKVAECLDVACPGELWAAFPTEDYIAADPSTHALITCTECDVTYQAVEWMGLGRRVLAARRATRAEDAA